jgi:BRO family, N-terminal domain
MKNVTEFYYNSNLVRMVLDDDGNPWWVLRDVCNILDLPSPSEVKRRLLEDGLKKAQIIDRLGRKQKVLIINEPGLYETIYLSKKDKAMHFKRWIINEVFPSILVSEDNQLSAPQLPASILPVANVFCAAVRMAKACGLKGNQAVSSANKLTLDFTGFEPLALLGLKHL